MVALRRLIRCCLGWEWPPVALLLEACRQPGVFRSPDLEPLGGLEL